MKFTVLKPYFRDGQAPGMSLWNWMYVLQQIGEKICSDRLAFAAGNASQPAPVKPSFYCFSAGLNCCVPA
jgi:hypothetical protein